MWPLTLPARTPIRSSYFRIAQAALALITIAFVGQTHSVFEAQFSPLAMGTPSVPLWVFHALEPVLVLGALGLLLNRGVRPGLVLLFLGYSGMLVLNPWAFWGWATAIRPMLLFLFLGTFVQKDKDPATSELWVLRLIQFLTAIVYLASSLSRLDCEPWLNGEMLGQTLADGIFGRYPWPFWYQVIGALKPFSYAAFALESLAFFLLFAGPRVSKWTALALIGLHLGLEATAFVQYWQPLMIVGLLSFLIPARIEPGPVNPRRHALTAFVVATALAFGAGAIPENWLAPRPLRQRDAFLRPFSFLGLDTVLYMRMFETHSPVGRFCFSGALVQPRFQLLWESDEAYCQGPRARLFHSELDTTLYRFYQRVYKAGDVKNMQRLGRWLCRSAGEPSGVVALTIARERYFKNANGDWSPRRKLSPLLVYDCAEHKSLPAPEDEVAAPWSPLLEHYLAGEYNAP